jgi:Flp pilus assembly pilin Flp
MSTLRQLLNERAVTAIEYGVIGVAVAAVVVAGFTSIGGHLSGMVTTANALW